MFEVLENDELAIMPSCSDKCWSSNRFKTFQEAQVYAYSWAYPLDIDSILQMIERVPFVLNEEKDCAMSGYPIFMKIVEVI